MAKRPSLVEVQNWGEIQLQGSHNQDWVQNFSQDSWPGEAEVGFGGAGPGFP